MNLDVQTILLNDSPQLLGILLELVASSDVIEQRRARELDVLGRKASSAR